jgi:Family of unknown function (DUF5763)
VAESTPSTQRSEKRRGAQCRAVKSNGERCRAIAGSGGYCSLHSDPGRARELGKLGGRGRTRSVLSIDPTVADDDLRAQARRRLELLVNSEDERTALAAARALYSYSAQRPPDELAKDWHPDRPIERHDVGSLLRKLVECRIIVCPTCDGTVEFDAEAWANYPGPPKFPSTSQGATGE